MAETKRNGRRIVPAKNHSEKKRNTKKKNNKRTKTAKKNNKVIKYKRKPKGIVPIFAVVIFYVISFIVMYNSKAKVKTYEIDNGSLTSNTRFTGIALRSEEVFYSSYSGNINYYQKEGNRVKVNDTIYTVDETGRVAEILSQYTKSDENSLTKENLHSIKSMLNNFRTNYDGSNFSALYDLKTDLNSTILQAMNESVINNLDSIVTNTGSENLFQTISAQSSGVIVYSIDGFEAVTSETITSSMFDKNNYKKQNLKAENIIVSDNPAYKLITDETWDIVFLLTQDEIDKNDLTDKKTVSINIKKDNIRAVCDFSLLNINDTYYGKLSLNKYMIRYATERFLDFELLSSTDSGLKIPTSAVTDSEFFIIPKSFMTTGGNSNTYGFICETYENGTLNSQFVAADIYKLTDTLCYVSKDDFTAGSNIVKVDSQERYIIGPTEKLKGVYCINSGYTVFKLVDIIDKNNEYIISKKGGSHGVAVYDRIVLDAHKYNANQMIY